MGSWSISIRATPVKAAPELVDDQGNIKRAAIPPMTGKESARAQLETFKAPGSTVPEEVMNSLLKLIDACQEPTEFQVLLVASHGTTDGVMTFSANNHVSLMSLI